MQVHNEFAKELFCLVLLNIVVYYINRYISTLYSHDGWPQIKCADVAPELRDRFNTNILSHFKLEFRDKMNEKRKRGQIVRFTDLFGMAIGNALLHVSTFSFLKQ